MTIEQNFERVALAIGNEDMSPDELDQAQAALSRIEEYVRAIEIETGANRNAVREIINERDALSRLAWRLAWP